MNKRNLSGANRMVEQLRIDQANQRVIELAITGNFPAAIALAQECVERSREMDDHLRHVRSLDNLGACLTDSGELSKAITVLEEALRIGRERLGDSPSEIAWSLSYLANALAQAGYGEQALEMRDAVLEIRKRVNGETSPEYATALANCAAAQAEVGHISEALALYDVLAELHDYIPVMNERDRVTHLSNMGSLLYETGDVFNAETALLDAWEIALDAFGENHPIYAAQFLAYATSSQFLTYEDRRTVTEYTVDIQRRNLGDRHPRTLDSLNYLGALLIGHDNSRAEYLLGEPLGYLVENYGPAHPFVAARLNNLAYLCHVMGRMDAATDLLRRALEILDVALKKARPADSRYPIHPTYAQCLHNLAVVCATKGRAAEALRLMVDASSIDDRILGQVFSASSDTQRLNYAETLRRRQDDLLSLILTSPRMSSRRAAAVMTVVLRRKALGLEALAIQRDAMLGSRYEEFRPQIVELSRLRARTSQIIFGRSLSAASSERSDILKELSQQQRRLEVRMAESIPEMDIGVRLREVDYGSIAAAIPSQHVLIEIARFSPRTFSRSTKEAMIDEEKGECYLAFVLNNPTGPGPRVVNLGSARRIDELIAQYRRVLSGDTPSWHQPRLGESGLRIGRELRAELWDPIARALGDHTKIILSPDGDIARLPFCALPCDSDGFLVDYFIFSYVVVGRDVLRFASNNRALTYPAGASEPVVIADPAFGLAEMRGSRPDSAPAASVPVALRERLASVRIPELASSRPEGVQVAAELGVIPWLGKDALKSRLMRCRSPLILHIATHGFFLEDARYARRESVKRTIEDWSQETRSSVIPPVEYEIAMQSGLLLAGARTVLQGEPVPPEAGNGILTAEDVTHLNLLNTEMVVLSACETGLGEVRSGEGVFGLSRAFVIAGAKSVIMSLWKVPDRATEELMIDFYDGLKSGLGRAEALRRAQQNLRERYPNPSEWGAFICQGAVGPLFPGHSALTSAEEGVSGR